MMQAIAIEDGSLVAREVDPPKLEPGCVRIRVAATAVNRADVLQRRGLYPPPSGASPLPGLECAGVIAEVADGVACWQPGARVMALLTGGGYAEEVVTPASTVLPVPEALSMEAAAALPETAATVHLNLFKLGQLGAGDLALVHGGSSGVGTTAITMARLAGARLVVTAGSDERCARCRSLGAELAINYRTGDFVEAVRSHTNGAGVPVVLDCVGGPYLDSNLRCLADDGRLVVIGLLGGRAGSLPMGLMLGKRLTVIGSTLRSRSPGFRGQLMADLLTSWRQELDAGRLAPVIDTVLPFADAAEAHRRMEAGEHFGKIVLAVSGLEHDAHGGAVGLD
jgi:putative PIG3 family NAD(P)H quinone oxidoreductase